MFAGLGWMLLWKLKFYNGGPVSHLAPGRLFRSVGFNFLQLSGEMGVDKISKVGNLKIYIYIPREVISLSPVAVAKLLVAAEIEIKLDCYNATAPVQRNKLYTASIK